MKFPMYKKETKTEGYHNDPFRAVNFGRDGEGNMICPNGKVFHFAYRKPVKGNCIADRKSTTPVKTAAGAHMRMKPIHPGGRDFWDHEI